MATMKTTSSLFLLFIYLFGVTNATQDPVLDVDGDALQTGVPYYVVSWIWGAGGGGLAPGRPGKGKPCPLPVIQRAFDDGVPVIFSNVDTNEGLVNLSNDVNIEFARSTLLCKSTVWMLGDYDESAGRRWVTTDGVKGSEYSPESANSRFKIEEAEGYAYKFRHCPKLCKTCTPLRCIDIGRSQDKNGQMRLALSSKPWGWLFKKADTTAWTGIKQVVNA